jgi:3-mercaptopyruvate sulfurtransferase SseA
MSIGRFAIFDFAGSLIWVSTFMGLGYLFHRQLERVADWASRFGTGMIVVIAGAFAGWALFKRWQRERFIRKLAVARVDPEDALHAIERGDLFVIDLRSADEYETAETKIPGAIWLNRRFLEEQAVEIPRDRDVLLYCT